MSDPWSRPPDEGDAAPAAPLDGVIEIELDGPGTSPTTDDAPVATGDTAETSEPNWRKIVGLSSLGGVVLGCVVAAVLFAGGDDDATPTTTTVDPVEAASRITTPPTLPLVEPTTPETTATLPEPPAATALPTYPEIAGADGEVVPGEYEFDLSYLVAPTAMETTIRYGNASDAGSLRVGYDAIADRYRVVNSGFDDAVVVVVDVATNTTFIPRIGESEMWQAVDSDTVLGRYDLDFEQYVRALLLGPVRPETTARVVSVSSGPRLVRLEDGEIVREHIVTLPASELPELEATYGSLGTNGVDVTYRVYVTRDGVLRRAEGRNDFGDETVVERFDFTLGIPVSIDLPDPESVSPAEVGEQFGDVDAESARPRYADADPDIASDDLPELAATLESFAASAATIVATTEIVGVPVESTRTERDPQGRLFRTVDDFDAGTPSDVQFDDVVTGLGYVRTGRPEEPWRSGELGTEIVPIDPRLVDGLLDADELAAGELVATRAVVIRGDSLAAEYQLLIPAGTVGDDTRLGGFLDTAAPFTVYLYALADETPPVVEELHVLTNLDGPVVWTQTFDYFQRDEFAPPTVAGD